MGSRRVTIALLVGGLLGLMPVLILQVLGVALPQAPVRQTMAAPEDHDLALVGMPRDHRSPAPDTRQPWGSPIRDVAHERFPHVANAPNPAPTVSNSADAAQPASHQITSTGTGQLGPRVPASVRRWEEPIVRWANHYGVDPNLVAALIMTESSGGADALSPKGAVGLMQVMGGSDNPEENIRQGTAILASQLERYGDLHLALAAYNAGPGNVNDYDGVPPFEETRNHLFRVLTRYTLYSQP